MSREKGQSDTDKEKEAKGFCRCAFLLDTKKAISKSRWQSGESDNLKRWYLKGQTDEPLGDTRFVFRISKYIIIIHIL